MKSKTRARTIAREMARRLDIENGDVVAIKKDTDIGDSIRIFNALRIAFGRTGREKCVIVVVNEFDDIAVMKESEMRAYGWCRCNS